MSEATHFGVVSDNVMQELPETGYLRLVQIVGRPANPKKNIPGIAGVIPVSRSTWWAGVRSGRYPQPVKIGVRCTAWRVEDIRTLIERAASAQVTV